MEESFKTGQVSNVGGQHNAPADRRYPSKQKQAKPQFSKLRPGEVVHGRIIKITGEQTALVHLPIGNSQAEIQGKLLPGDELFLLVAETTPNLILKVYSVSTIKNKKPREVKDIIRILDLPENKEFIELVNVAIAFENTVVRDDVLSLLRQYSSLTRTELTDFNLNAILVQLWRFKIAEIEFDRELFLSTLPFAARVNEISNDFKILFERSNFLEDLKISNEGSNKSSIQDYFERLIFVNKLFFDRLQKSSYKFNQNDESLVNTYKKVKEYLYSMFFQNTLFFHKQLIFQFITPIIYKNQFRVLLFTFRMKNLNLQEKIRMRSKIDSSGYFDVYEYLYDIILSDNSKSYESKIKYTLPDGVMNFINHIMSLPIIVEKILLLKDEGIEEIYSGNTQTSNTKSISVVL